ncbi:hypothetical protein SAMN05216206_2325 [Pseudomonas guineae]|uniref:Uncharacterized protein n=1 Tax=Pseudomonas guineae TaxID=425504 RepID=A0A1I3ICZ4_9PSED|nr:hypothetical protein SAMN05216206_2325 [Pseudomonas guineae]
MTKNQFIKQIPHQNLISPLFHRLDTAFSFPARQSTALFWRKTFPHTS